MPPLSSNKAEPTLALKPRGDVTRSPKIGVSVAPQKGLMSSKNLKKKKKSVVRQKLGQFYLVCLQLLFAMNECSKAGVE